MPSTENTTLQRIQREISDVIEREKELRSFHMQNGTDNHEHETNNNISAIPHPAKPVLYQSKSVTTNGTQNNINGTRLFTPNPAAKGVMHKFIKSRGKMTTVRGFQGKPIETPQQQPITWSIPDVIEPPRVTEPGKLIRKGYVPIEVRMKKEFEDLHHREMELRTVRRKSQGDVLDSDEVDDIEASHLETTLRPAKSMAQLYDSDEYNNNEFHSMSPQLKPARSLADLCDVSEDELDLPGSHSLIMQWEEMIQKKST